MERRVVAIVGSVIVVLTVLAVLVPLLVGRPGPAPRPTPVAPTMGSGSAVEVDVPVQGEDFPPPPAGCPGPLVDPSSHVAVDWVPMVVAGGREYWGGDERTGLVAGPTVVEIRCDISAISGGGRAVVPKPWPDGSSTHLGVGTVVTEVAGFPRECFLMADTGAPVLFRAVDEGGGTPEECVAVPEP